MPERRAVPGGHVDVGFRGGCGMNIFYAGWEFPVNVTVMGVPRRPLARIGEIFSSPRLPDPASDLNRSINREST